LVWFNNRIVARIPDPEDYFGVEGQESSGGFDVNLHFEFAEDPAQMLHAYCTYIAENEKHIAYEYTDGEDNDKYELHYTGPWLKDNRTLLRIIDYRNDYYGADSDNRNYVIKFMAESNCKMKASDAYVPGSTSTSGQEEPTAMTEQETVPEQTETEATVAITGPTLPNPDAFFAGNIPRGEDFYVEDSGHWVISYAAEIDTGTLAMQEYVSLLCDERFNLELFHETEETVLYLQTFSYFFRYTGEEDVPDVTWDNYYGADDDPDCDLGIRIQRNGKTETVLMSVYFKPDVYEFIDCPEITSYYVPKVVPNNDDDYFDDDDPYIPDFAKEPCLTCDGDGDCTECGGYGTIKRYNGDGEYIDSTCPECHGNRKCSTCNGSGTRE